MISYAEYNTKLEIEFCKESAFLRYVFRNVGKLLRSEFGDLWHSPRISICLVELGLRIRRLFRHVISLFCVVRGAARSPQNPHVFDPVPG